MNKGKGSKMKKELEGKFVHVPHRHVSEAVQKMLFEHGYEWGDRPGQPQYTDVTCLHLSGKHLSHSPIEWARKPENCRGKTEISITELADILSKPTHTLMTPDELKIKTGASVFNTERALVLSIEKWERLLEPENWEELCEHPNKYLRGDTCALCRLHHGLDFERLKTPDCGSCALVLHDGRTCNYGEDHPWARVRDAVRDGDRERFEYHAKDLLKILRNALEELRKPKEYRLGQFFLMEGEENDEGDELMVLGRSDVDHTALIVVGNKEADTGNMWSNFVGKGEGSTSLQFTQKQLDKMSGSRVGGPIPVDVKITVVNKEKK